MSKWSKKEITSDNLVENLLAFKKALRSHHYEVGVTGHKGKTKIFLSYSYTLAISRFIILIAPTLIGSRSLKTATKAWPREVLITITYPNRRRILI